jgi:Tol biopolymer transport system component
MVARADGSGVTVVTAEPVLLTPSILGEPWPQYEFSPDGTSILFAWTAKGAANLSIADSAGGGVRQLDVGMAVYEPSFRPPDGAEILFVGPDTGPVGSGIFAVNVTTGVVRTIVQSSSVFDVAGATWSPNGSRIAYWRWGGSGSGNGLTAKVRVVAADGTGDRQLFSPPAAIWTAGTDWSNEGTRILTTRGYGQLHEDDRAVVVAVDGDSPEVEIRIPELINGGCCAHWEWAPDDSAILGTPADYLGAPLQQIIVDPLTGQARPAPWSATSDPAWQRTGR